MLFILIMDVLCHLIKKVADEHMLQLLARRVLQHRNSLYADDVVLFLRPLASDIEITLRDEKKSRTVGSGITIQKMKVVSSGFFRIYEINKIKYGENDYKIYYKQ